MHITLQLKKMSTEEKIQTMEIIWDDLCKNADKLSSPLWHRDVLQVREERIKQGDDKFVDWENSKRHILKTIK